MKKINLLGATGSIGQQTLAVVRAHSNHLAVVALSAGRNISALRDMIAEFRPRLVSVQCRADAEKLQTEYPSLRVVYGQEGLSEVACFPEGDMVVNAVMGRVGLEATLAAIAAGKDIGLANKETLVTAGHLVMTAVKEAGVALLPIDSEHSAIFQCLQGNRHSDVARIILTASGGSFRNLTRDELTDVTVAQALNHPNWSMGAKITIDSATMMNKGLEVIEAHWLFGLPYEQIDVMIHAESIVHSLVEYHDSSVMAQLGTPDMRMPIQLALTYPERWSLADSKRLNLLEAETLSFKTVDFERFPCVKMAFEAGKAGGTMPTVLNAANEAAVDLFLQEKIPFLSIETLVEEALQQHQVISFPDLATITAVDQEIRTKIYKKVL